MVAHAVLTGAELHEPKDVASASANTVYVADGAGSGVWEKITSASLDTATVFANRFHLTVLLDDISTASSVYVGVPEDSTFEQAVVTLQGPITVADSTLTFRNNAGTSMGTGVVAFLGSGAGTSFSFSGFSNDAFLSGQRLQVETDGNSTTTAKLWVTLTFVQTG